MYYRRHIIVHNDSRIDKRYVHKIGTGKIGSKLITDELYIEKAFDVTARFVDYIDSVFSLKMKYNKDPKYNVLLQSPQKNS
jgi:hypothetical protein